MLPDFTHPMVRDLAWLAFSGPLLTEVALPLRDPLRDSVWRRYPEQLLAALQRLDAEPGQLPALLAQTRDRRLGNYYERLWHALLSLAPDVEILAHNLALREAGRTLGELDLVIRAANGEIVHLELAIKFYLGRPELQETDSNADCSDAALWWGPDPSDQLARKIQRLKEHQLPLGRHLQSGGKSELFSHYPGALPQPDCSAAWLQGCLFQSAAQRMPPACVQAAQPADRLWCHRSEVELWLPANSKWIALPHKHWLMPPRPEEAELFSPAQMSSVFEKARALQPVMFIRADPAGEYQPLRADRLICVADGWPA
ncbi:MAG: DUF1853 family protein [Halopseudomonas sp.]|uniref:DUF1853 family protein n=1 Tax=Halopseudomonas sp. TaxID=2901191 RepID=UPI0030015E15